MEPTATPRAFVGLGERESTVARSAGAWRRRLGPRRTNAVFRHWNDGCHRHRKRLGNGSASTGAYWRAPLSQEKIRFRRFFGACARGDSRSARGCACVRSGDESLKSPLHLPAPNVLESCERESTPARSATTALAGQRADTGPVPLLFVDRVASCFRGLERRHPRGRDGDGLHGLGIAPGKRRGYGYRCCLSVIHLGRDIPI